MLPIFTRSAVIRAELWSDMTQSDDPQIAPDDPQIVPVEPRKPATPARRIVRLLLWMLLVAAIIGGGLLVYGYSTSPTMRDTVAAVITRADKPENAFPGRDHINVLLMGRDLDRNNHDQVVRTNGRTDCMMLARIDFKKHAVDILSIPRDTLVRIPGYRHKNRISYANAYGGPDLAVETVTEFLGVSPDYYMLVNFDGFALAIDQIGGLEVDVDKKLEYDDNWGNVHIHLKPGRQRLNGVQAMGFVRYRKSNDGGGDSDFVRIGRQQQFMTGLKNRLSAPGVILKVPGVMDSIRQDMEGSLSTAQIVCLARFMKSLSGGSGIRMYTLPALDTGGVYVHVDEKATEELVQRVFLNNQR